jgi:hypothetical protein
VRADRSDLPAKVQQTDPRRRCARLLNSQKDFEVAAPLAEGACSVAKSTLFQTATTRIKSSSPVKSSAFRL